MWFALYFCDCMHTILLLEIRYRLNGEELDYNNRRLLLIAERRNVIGRNEVK